MNDRKTPLQSASRFYALSLLVVVLVFAAVNARWVWIYRHGGVYDIDEAGYLSLAVIDHLGLNHHGLLGWISAIEIPNIQAPLTTMLASVLFSIAGPHIVLGFGVTIIAGAGCVTAAYALGRSVGSGGLALAAAIMTASCPVIINYARSFQFSTVATLVTTLALVSILRSRRFRDLRWSLVFGLCLGLMPLARTMLIAFIPGLMIAALVAVLGDRSGRLQRLFTLAAAAVLAAVVAATWLAFNGVLVAKYLLNYGYGAQSVEYGPHSSKLGVDAWIATARALNAQIFLPHLLLLVLGSIAAVAVVLREVWRHGTAGTALRLGRSPIFPITIFVVEALLVLTTTRNKGTGFFAPIVPAGMVLAAWAFGELGGSKMMRAIPPALIAIVATVAVVPLLDLRTPFAQDWSANVPILGEVTVTKGKGTIQDYETSVGYGAPNAVEPVSGEVQRKWNNLSNWTAAMLTTAVGPQAGIAYGFRNALYNVNTINLEQLLARGTVFSGRMVEPTLTGESVLGYLGWLKREGWDACGLLTSDRPGGDFAPAINRTMMQAAAQAAGFVVIATWPAPDGEIVTFWKHNRSPQNCR